MNLDFTYAYIDAWWAARGATPEYVATQIAKTLESITGIENPDARWTTFEPNEEWPTKFSNQLAVVKSNVFLTDPDSNGHVEAQPHRGYTLSMHPRIEPTNSRIIKSIDFWVGSETRATLMVFNRVSIEFENFGRSIDQQLPLKFFESLASTWRPDFISLSTDGTRELVDASFTSPRPGLVMWFSDRLPCTPGVKSLGYPRLGEGVLVDLRSLVEDSDDPVASLTKVYAQLENVGAFDPIPPMSPIKD
ncbi:hypothetical protein [Haematomicrobium sanguinis]|uniref:hypothetical protein n=1 Tax=Haematomicrobium sanguinis TaxID=479106 RepID=UPI0012FAF63C|nr:hypothetical protein [Haematomicrobium sanguinis]